MVELFRRRELLSGLAVASVGLSGCFNFGSGDDASLWVYNERSEQQSFSLTVTNLETDEEVVSTEFQLDSEDGRDFALEAADHNMIIESDSLSVEKEWYSDGDIVLEVVLTENGFETGVGAE